MNQLEKLTEENQKNDERYLSIMDSNTFHTTKNLIPLFLQPTRILDVGCGGGSLLKLISDTQKNREAKEKIPENAKQLERRGNIEKWELLGVDLNSHHIQHCKEVYRGLPMEFRVAKLEDLYAEGNEKFNTIIFSSVLHEISSYAETGRYSARPIEEALKTAYKLLMPSGRIIIRDGCATISQKPITFQFRNPDDVDYFVRFCAEYHAKHPWYQLEHGGRVTTPIWYAKEFLCTYTWGEESWSREVGKQFGILSQRGWRNLIEDAGFRIHTQLCTSEEYIEYILKKVILTPENQKLIKDFVILMIAEKLI